MQIQTKFSPKEYMRALRGRLGSFTDFGCERFTGIVVGRFFSVTHHAGHEWNRRITNERNSAVGYVKETPDGAKVCCLRQKGWTTPQALLLMLTMCVVILLIASRGMIEMNTLIKLTLGMTAFMALFTAVCDSFTERGIQGEQELYALLYDPSNPLAYLERR